MGDSEAARISLSPEEKEVFVEELITEISVYLGMLYHLIEALKGYEDFADELSMWLLHGHRFVSRHGL